MADRHRQTSSESAQGVHRPLLSRGQADLCPEECVALALAPPYWARAYWRLLSAGEAEARRRGRPG